MFSLNCLSYFVNEIEEDETIVVHFDEVEATKNIGYDEDQLKIEYKYDYKESRREVNEEVLLSVEYEFLLREDPALALAKLRIEIEKKLKSIKFGNKNQNTPHVLQIGRVARELEAEGELPSGLADAISHVLPACHKAIHGGVVDVSTARSIVAVGVKIISLLDINKKNAV